MFHGGVKWPSRRQGQILSCFLELNTKSCSLLSSKDSTPKFRRPASQPRILFKVKAFEQLYFLMCFAWSDHSGPWGWPCQYLRALMRLAYGPVEQGEADWTQVEDSLNSITHLDTSRLSPCSSSMVHCLLNNTDVRPHHPAWCNSRRGLQRGHRHVAFQGFQKAQEFPGQVSPQQVIQKHSSTFPGINFYW